MKSRPVDIILFELNALLREELGISVIVYGSLGVELALLRDYGARDIDIIIDEDFEKRKPTIEKCLSGHGYKRIASPYFAFGKHGIDIEISDIDHWINACAISKPFARDLMINGDPIRAMTRENLLKLYTFLSTLPERAGAKHDRDLMKLIDLKAAA